MLLYVCSLDHAMSPSRQHTIYGDHFIQFTLLSAYLELVTLYLDKKKETHAALIHDSLFYLTNYIYTVQFYNISTSEDLDLNKVSIDIYISVRRIRGEQTLSKTSLLHIGQVIVRDPGALFSLIPILSLHVYRGTSSTKVESELCIRVYIPYKVPSDYTVSRPCLKFRHSKLCMPNLSSVCLRQWVSDPE